MTNNNFDFLRLIFALFVIVSHSYILTGNTSEDWLYRSTLGQTMWSKVGVMGFFIISGYLVFQSLSRSPSALDYLLKRLRRILPGLFVMLLFTIIVLPLVYDNSVFYLKNIDVLTYIPRNMILATQHRIAGVFSGNPYPNVINGSLWTIRYEVLLYIILLCFIKVRHRKSIVATISFTIWIGSITLLWLLDESILEVNFIFRVKNLLQLSSCFFSGVMLASVDFHRAKKILPLVAICSVVLFVIAAFYNLLDHIFFVIMPFLVLSIALYPLPYIRSIGKTIGDISYGIYIYSFLIQQMIVYFLKPTTTQLLLLSIVITIPIAFASWHLVEKRFLQRK